MTQDHDSVEHRHKLYKTYMVFGSIGLLLTFASNLYVYYNMYSIALSLCLRLSPGDPSCYSQSTISDG